MCEHSRAGGRGILQSHIAEGMDTERNEKTLGLKTLILYTREEQRWWFCDYTATYWWWCEAIFSPVAPYNLAHTPLSKIMWPSMWLCPPCKRSIRWDRGALFEIHQERPQSYYCIKVHTVVVFNFPIRFFNPCHLLQLSLLLPNHPSQYHFKQMQYIWISGHKPKLPKHVFSMLNLTSFLGLYSFNGRKLNLVNSALLLSQGCVQ